MNGLEALGYMGSEAGKIVKIRNLKRGPELGYSDLMEGRKALVLFHSAIVSDEWELGWECPKCCGTGIVSGYTGNKNNPDYVESPCPDCDEGVKWEKEY